MKKLVSFLIIFIFKTALAQLPYILVTEGYNGRVSKIDPVTNTKIASIKVADSTGAANFATTDIVIDTVHNWAFVSCNASNRVAIINLNNWTTTYPSNPVIAGFGQQPIGITINKTATKLYLTTRGATGTITSTNPVEVIDIVGNTFPPTLTKSANIPVGKHPIKVLLSHNQQFGVVSCRNESRVSVFSVATNSVIFNHNYANSTFEPEGLAIHPTQPIVYITNHGANTIDILNLTTMSVVATVSVTGGPPAPQPSGGMFSPNGTKFALFAQSSHKVYFYNTTSPLAPVLTGTIMSGGQQPHTGVFLNDSIAYVPNTNNLNINGGVARFNINSLTPAAPLAGTWNGPLGMALVKQTATSILELNAENSTLSAFPNPVKNKLHFHIKDQSTIMEVTIIDGIGKQQKLPVSNNEVDLSFLPEGLYVVLAKDEKGKFYQDKIIKE